VGAMEAMWLGPCSQGSGHAYWEGYAFDTIGRPTTVTTVADQSYTISMSYYTSGLEQGRLESITYPVSVGQHPLRVRYDYQNGLLKSVRDWTGGSLGTIYWQANAQNARGQITQETFGNRSEERRVGKECRSRWEA